MNCFKFLSVHVAEDLSWAQHKYNYKESSSISLLPEKIKDIQYVDERSNLTSTCIW